MQRHEMIAQLKALGLKGMANAFDEAVTPVCKRAVLSTRYSPF